jgi:GNAT superfamily N-acetyltransferase
MIEIACADLATPAHRAAVLALTRAYARHAMGGGRDLPGEVQQRLVDGLAAHPTAHVFLAFAGERPVGIATCFLGFSTFAARPVLNVHDLFVDEAHLRRGIAQRLLAAAEEHARAHGCAKLTLEVFEQNHPARALYERFGFEAAGLFRAKPLRP